MSLSSLRLVERSLYLDCVQVLELHYHFDLADALAGVGDEDFAILAKAAHAREW